MSGLICREKNEVAMALTISEADLMNAADAAAVLELLQAYAADPMGGSSALAAEVVEHLIPRLAAVESRFVLIARMAGRPAGVAIAFRGFSTFRARPVLNLHDLAVHPDFRGQGIGRELLSRVEAFAQSSGCCRVSLEVRSDNAQAQRLYRSQGFGPGDPPQEFWTKSLLPDR